MHDRIRFSPWIIRGIIWVGIFFLIEYLSGWSLKTVLGVSPWDYTNRTPYSIDGFIRLDYFPVWFFAGLIFEKVHDYIIKIQSEIK